MASLIHPTAVIEKGAEIADGVSVGAYSIIGANVKIGSGTSVGPHAVITGHTMLGENNQVYQFASVGAPPQDLKYKGEPSTLEIGNENIIREYVTLQPGTAHGHMRTVVGSRNLFMASSHVGHDSVVGDGNVFANCVSLAGHVTIMNNTILGGLVAIHQFTRIGDFAMLGGGAMVNNDIPPYCIAQGDRACLRGVNVIGLKRAGFSEEQVKEVRKVYRTLFSTLGHLEQKLEEIEQEVAEKPHIKMFLDFIRSSERGVAHPSKHKTNED